MIRFWLLWSSDQPLLGCQFTNVFPFFSLKDGVSHLRFAVGYPIIRFVCLAGGFSWFSWLGWWGSRRTRRPSPCTGWDSWILGSFLGLLIICSMTSRLSTCETWPFELWTLFYRIHGANSTGTLPEMDAGIVSKRDQARLSSAGVRCFDVCSYAGFSHKTWGFWWDIYGHMINHQKHELYQLYLDPITSGMVTTVLTS